MLYLQTENLMNGMNLARDLHFFDVATKQPVVLRAGKSITGEDIGLLRRANIDGAYVLNVAKSVRFSGSVNDEIREEAVKDIERIAEIFAKNPNDIRREDIDHAGETAFKLIDSIHGSSDILVNIDNLKAYDDYTFHHSLCVAVLSIAIGMELGFNDKRQMELGLCGMLHDIGKTHIPVDIITKPDKLTADEFNIVKQHPVEAAEIIFKKGIISNDVYSGILSHHERFDGSGYPNHLAGKSIPIFGRILAVADVFDALTSSRSYRTASTPSEAVEYIMGGMGTHFDEEIVKAFLKKVAPYPIGTVVLLNTGERAVVLQNNLTWPLRPVLASLDKEAVYDLYNDHRLLKVVIVKALHEDTQAG